MDQAAIGLFPGRRVCAFFDGKIPGCWPQLNFVNARLTRFGYAGYRQEDGSSVTTLAQLCLLQESQWPALIADLLGAWNCLDHH